MGDVHCTCSHRRGLYFAKILWDHIFSLNRLVPKCITYRAAVPQENSSSQISDQPRTRQSAELRANAAVQHSKDWIVPDFSLTIRNIHSPLSR